MYEISQPENDWFNILSGRTRVTKLRAMKHYHLTPLYFTLVTISDAKFNYLTKLYKKNVIPRMHHNFYSQLSHTSNVCNILEDPEEDNSDWLSVIYSIHGLDILFELVAFESHFTQWHLKVTLFTYLRFSFHFFKWWYLSYNMCASHF